jgi:hypothetical protein
VAGEVVGVGCCLVELFGTSVAVGSGSVEVGFCSFGADADGGSCFFQRGEPCVGGCVEFVAFALRVGPDECDFFGRRVNVTCSALDGACKFRIPPMLARRPGS